MLLVYGANGYTGRLIARRCLERGLEPVLSGRDAEAIRALGRELGLEARPAALDSPRLLDGAFDGITTAIHCAGPFSRTARVMAEACIRSGAHYLDITGEIPVFEMLVARSAEAARAGVMLLPGAGFDVVPSDCLAAHLHRRLPSATSLRLAFFGGTGLSRGTDTTMIENIGAGGAVRRDGKIVGVPVAYRERDIDFGDKVRHAVTIPWGDVSTAFHSTGIPDIEVYAAASPGAVRGLKLAARFGRLLASAPAQALLKAMVRRGPPGPTEEVRRRATARLWGEAFDDAGRTVRSRLSTPDGYTLTALAAVAAAEKCLAGNTKPGFQTPSSAYGANFILEIEGTERLDLPEAPAL